MTCENAVRAVRSADRDPLPGGKELVGRQPLLSELMDPGTTQAPLSLCNVQRGTYLRRARCRAAFSVILGQVLSSGDQVGGNFGDLTGSEVGGLNP